MATAWCCVSDYDCVANLLLHVCCSGITIFHCLLIFFYREGMTSRWMFGDERVLYIVCRTELQTLHTYTKDQTHAHMHIEEKERKEKQKERKKGKNNQYPPSFPLQRFFFFFFFFYRATIKPP
eukprot:TRINITY_DN9482_c0_g1_i1.p1 TRINITY_DN9482_c0_g1~~TRINITY_DN9482_c0_g1_i1.p1  ORF type:complete len:123 (-),score=13.10 TRINITY_DN9482_c0_g1_i1:40-408(-)